MQNSSMLTAAALSSQPMTLQQSAAAAAHLVPTLPSSPQPVSVFQPPIKPSPGPQQLGHQQQAATMQHFLLASQFPVPQAPLQSTLASQSQISKPLEAAGGGGGGGGVGGGLNPVSLVEMASIISPMTKRRAESFVLEEIRVMLQEIERRKHILLSVSPASNKLKRRAWEEVANCMALRWPQETRRTGDQIKKKWENLVSKTKRKIRDGHMTPDLDWNETNTLVMQFLASTTAAMRRRPVPPPAASTNTMSSLFDYGHLLPACTAGSGDTNVTTYGNAGNSHNYLAVFPSTVTDSTFNGASSNAGATAGGGCNNMGHKMEDGTDRVGHDESSNDGTPLEETEPSSRDGEPSVPGNNRSGANHNASAWTNLSVDESVLSNLAPLGGNPLLNIPHLGLHPNSAAMQEELMAHARLEHRLRVQILRMQKRAWNLKLEWLERRRTRSRQNDGDSEATASASLNANSTTVAADASLQNGGGGGGGDSWALPREDLAGEDEEEEDEDEEEEEEEDL
nr:unnamed protein product [Spirometra erinaceieuropaei]